MNAPVRLLFDENTGAPFVDALREIVRLNKKQPVEIGHTIALFGRGAKDLDWIPKVVDNSWIVISEDRGVNSAAGDKLPVICAQLGVTHVLVLPSILRNGGQFEKMRAIMAIWPELILLPTLAAGTRLKLRYANSTRSSFRLAP